MNTNHVTSIGEIEARNVYRCTSLVIRSEPRKRDAFERALAQTWGSSEASEWESGQGRCKVCGTAIDDTPTVVFVAGADLTLPCNVCDDCMEIVRDHYSQHGEEPDEITTTPNWDRDCPPRFRDAVLADELPPRVDRDANARVMRWDSASMRGPLMTGAPGTGKTTTFWALARKLEQAGHSPKCLSSVELGRILSNAAKDIREVSWLYNSRVLMIDDLGKEKLTPSVASLLWEVLDRRYGLGHPLVLTTQFSGSQLEQRFGEEHLGQSIRRRLNEVCFTVPFAAQATDAASSGSSNRTAA